MFEKIHNKTDMKSSTETDFEESPEFILSKITEQLESAKSTGRKLTKEIKKWCLILGISASPLLTRAQQLAIITEKDLGPEIEAVDFKPEKKEEKKIMFSYEGGNERMLEYHSVGFYNIKAGENIKNIGKYQRGDYENIESPSLEKLDDESAIEFVFSNHMPRGSQGYNISYELELIEHRHFKFKDGTSHYEYIYELVPNTQKVEEKTPYQIDTVIRLSNLEKGANYKICVPVEGQRIRLYFSVKE